MQLAGEAPVEEGAGWVLASVESSTHESQRAEQGVPWPLLLRLLPWPEDDPDSRSLGQGNRLHAGRYREAPFG